MTRRFYNGIVVVVLFLLCTWTFSRISTESPTVLPSIRLPTPTPSEPQELPKATPVTWEDAGKSPEAKEKPKPGPEASVHPIAYLESNAREEFERVQKRQSTSLGEAVKEYRRRYGMPPPPLFDKWWELASRNGVQLVDEFDTIRDLLAPFWGLQPKTIRARVKEALGFDNGLLGVAIREGGVMFMQGGSEWQQNATKGMMGGFIQHLPDMDLAFNLDDEPRVVIPHDDLARLLDRARQEAAALSGKTSLVNGFSGRPAEVNDGRWFEETKLTRFSSFPHQASWTHSRMSCPPDSPARILDDDESGDDLSAYSVGELGFVYNTTAMSDVCLTPSLASSFGFFDRPNSYRVVQDLIPIFSQSKISSYADILYPSPWYWYEKVSYNETRDVPWSSKKDDLYWRGSTTGGFSRLGGWRRQHRQILVAKINARGQAGIMARGADGRWAVEQVARGDYRGLVDVRFSHIGQCDPGDCDAQAQYFNVSERVDQQDAWTHRHLLDMDGNAFSGRFYAFLRSRSLTFKRAVFREWHDAWLRAWVHYVPLSLRGEEWLEAARYFSQGGGEGEKMAEESRGWAGKTLRKEDLEAWFFRLLLEYARVIDDNRVNLGFDLSDA